MLKTEISNAFFFALLVLVLYGIGRILEPFAGALLAAFCLAVLFYPLYGRVNSWLPRANPTLGTVITMFAVLFLLLLPVAIIGWVMMSESETLQQAMHGWGKTLQQIRQGGFVNKLPFLSHIRQTLGVGPSEFQHTFVEKFSKGLEAIAAFGSSLAQNTFNFVFQLLMMLFTLFFFLRDGEKMEAQVTALIPMPQGDTEALITRTHEVVIGVVRGWLLTSIVQGVLATAGYLVVRAEGAVLLGVLTAGIGLIPVVGTFGVWIPVGVLLIAQGAIWKGVFVLCWGAFVVVGFVDTLVRPYLVGQRAELPLMPLFFGLLGGVEVFGVKGVVIGPLLMALAPSLLEIYRQRYLHKKAVE